MTVVSSNSSEHEVPTGDASKPLITLDDVGVFYRRQARGHSSLRRILLNRRGAGEQAEKDSGMTWALRHINCTCHAGQTLGVVGHTGAGKSTFCLVLAQILAPDEGTADIQAEVSPLLSLGAGLNPELSGRANINLYAAFLGVPRKVIAEKAARIIEFSELGDAIDEPIRAYSKGMRARLSFSIASSIDPEVLILDEAMSVGDARFQKKSKQRLQTLIGQSKLIVVVSHSASYLRDTCSHALWLDHGQVRAFGTADDVLGDYEKWAGVEDKHKQAAPDTDEI